MIVWLNGKQTEDSAAHIDPADRGLLLGDGLFETFAVRRGTPLFCEAHLDRLHRGLKALGFASPYSSGTLFTAAKELIAANGLGEAERASLRLTVTRGPGPRGLLPPETPRPTVLISCGPAAEPPQNIAVVTSAIRRNELSPLANLKVLPYLEQVLAKHEAQAGGADDALMLNTKGKLACASAANIFLWDSDTLITPPLSDGCLDGTMRGLVLKAASRAGITLFEESITPSTVANVGSAFLTNSLVELQTVGRIDGRALSPHRRMSELREAVEELTAESLTG